MGYKIKLETFEGPFDLLLHLIEKAEVDIYSIPIAQITDQYLDYLEAMKKIDLEVTSEFLVMAATLIKLKSSMLLPKLADSSNQDLEEDDETITNNLIAKLAEYKHFKEVGNMLKEKETAASFIYYKTQNEHFPKKVDLDLVLNKISLQELWNIFMNTFEKTDNKNYDVQVELQNEEIRLEEKMIEIINLLTRSKSKLIFSQLFNNYNQKIQIVVTFLAVLELIRLNKVSVFQSVDFGEIYLSLRSYK